MIPKLLYYEVHNLSISSYRQVFDIYDIFLTIKHTFEEYFSYVSNSAY